MANKKTLDDLILEVLSEREYVSGSKLPTRPATKKVDGGTVEIPEDFDMPYFYGIPSGTVPLERAIQRLAAFCNDQGLTALKKAEKTTLSERFKRMVAVEMLHKLLSTAIPETGGIGFDSRSAGFGLEKTFSRIFGGSKIVGSGANDVLFKRTGMSDLYYSIKFYSEGSINKYGFGQKFKTIFDWLQDTNTKLLRYIIFVKRGDDEQVGFDVYMTEYNKEYVKNLVNKYSASIGGSTMPERERIIYNAFKEDSKYNKILKRYEKKNPEVDPDTIEDSTDFRKHVLASGDFNKFRKKYFGRIKDEVPLYRGELPSPERHLQVYTVEKDGETKGEIAKKLGNSITRLNNLNTSGVWLGRGKKREPFEKGDKIRYEKFETPEETDFRTRGRFDPETYVSDDFDPSLLGLVDFEEFFNAKATKTPLTIKPEKPLRFIASLLLPRKIDDLLQVSFREMEDHIKELYESLDVFKDSLIEYHKGQQTDNERANTASAFKGLKNSYEKHLEELTEKEKPTGEAPAELGEQKNKTKKDLDKLIERVILEHINK